MISYISQGNRGVPAAWKMVGLSTDTKPTEDIPNGSLFFQMDNNKYFMYDASGEKWWDVTAAYAR